MIEKNIPTKEEIKEEDRKIRYLRRMVDFTIVLILEDYEMTLEEASKHVASVKEFAERLFPGKGGVFDMVYGPRFKRLLTDKYMLS